jgi:ribosomal protein S12 methylthiotransferase accessory factor
LQAVELRPIMPQPLEQTLSVLTSFLSPYTGIARNYVELLHAPDEGRLVSLGCALAHGEPVIGIPITDHSGGSHGERRLALAAALGEAIERYSASYLPESGFVTASADDLHGEAVDPDRFALFHEEQYGREGFPFRRFERETRLRWTEGFRIPDGARAYLPVQLAYIRPPIVDEHPIGYSTSNGVACGATLEEAILGGLFEVIERDAFMITWYNRLSLPRLIWDGDRAMTELIERSFAPAGLDYSLIDLSVFFDVPTVLGVVHGPPGQLGALGVGAGCAVTIHEACRKALSESFAVRRWARDMAYAEPDRRPSTSSDIQTFDDHILYYAEERNSVHARFLDSSPVTRHVQEISAVEGSNVKEQIGALARRLAQRGLSAYAVDVTSPDVRSSGLSVARVIAPELCQLDVLDTARLLGGRRLYFAAYEAGLRSEPLALADVNIHPHPFP